MIAIAHIFVVSINGPIVRLIYENNETIDAFEILYWRSLIMILFTYGNVKREN